MLSYCDSDIIIYKYNHEKYIKYSNRIYIYMQSTHIWYYGMYDYKRHSIIILVYYLLSFHVSFRDGFLMW